ncbi:MAG: hypothetical protein KC657_15120 [Myxococcales bacterium]|nr:hypothetical protein [Myxococcales bacterium]
MKSLQLSFALVLGASALVIAACSSSNKSDEAAPCNAYVVPPGTDLTTPKVSFQADVVPIIKRSCTDAACHGSKGASEGIFLPPDNPGDMYAALTGPATSTLSMNVATPGDPAKSFVMHKLDGDQCTVTCVKGGCGDRMPPDGQLPVETRDVIRRWIAQGAKND